MAATPNTKQMVTRSLDGHRKAIRAIAEGRPVLGPTASMGEVRGMRTVLGTLQAWETVEAVDGALRLTERGRDLLAAYDAQRDRLRGVA